MQRRGYRPALDGLRAFAAMTVLVAHASGDSVPGTHFPILGGWVGVDVFFVLSGYLITSLLVHERVRSGAISLWFFYARRALRLLPAAVATIGLAMLIALTLRPDFGQNTGRQAVAALAYVANWWAYGAAPGSDHTSLLEHTWSLSIEEQFYLCWPIILCCLMAIGVRRAAFRGALVMMVAFTVRQLTAGDVATNGGYYRTDVRVASLLVGCVLALGASLGYWERLRTRTVQLLGIGGMTVLVAVILTLQPRALGFTTVALATSAVLLSVLGQPEGHLARMLGSRPFVWVGQRSYGIYLYHYPLMMGVVFPRLEHSPVAAVAATAALTIPTAALSFRYLEQPFLRLKRRVTMPDPVAVQVAA